MIITDKIDQEIYTLGQKLIDTTFFQASKNQVHHKKVTLFDHTMAVTRRAVKLCDLLEKKGKEINRQSVILAALCHDIGMIGRDVKYKSDFEAWGKHPEESAKLTREFFPDIEDQTLEIIRKHMWPLTTALPTCREEWILIQADKVTSYHDIRGSRRREDEDIN